MQQRRKQETDIFFRFSFRASLSWFHYPKCHTRRFRILRSATVQSFGARLSGSLILQLFSSEARFTADAEQLHSSVLDGDGGRTCPRQHSLDNRQKLVTRLFRPVVC